MTRLRLAAGVAAVEDVDRLYLARLPEGPIMVLDEVGAVIWAEACNGERETLASRVRAAFDSAPEEIDDQVDEFVQVLIDRGLLEESLHG